MFVKRFFGDNFIYYLFFFAETYMLYVNVLYVVRNVISAEYDKKETFPHRPLL